MSQLLHARSEAAASGGKTKKQCVPHLPDIDSADAADPLNACDFVSDIFSYYKRVEPQLRVAPDYMSRQVRREPCSVAMGVQQGCCRDEQGQTGCRRRLLPPAS